MTGTTDNIIEVPSLWTWFRNTGAVLAVLDECLETWSSDDGGWWIYSHQPHKLFSVRYRYEQYGLNRCSETPSPKPEQYLLFLRRFPVLGSGRTLRYVGSVHTRRKDPALYWQHGLVSGSPSSWYWRRSSQRLRYYCSSSLMWRHDQEVRQDSLPWSVFRATYPGPIWWHGKVGSRCFDPTVIAVRYRCDTFAQVWRKGREALPVTALHWRDRYQFGNVGAGDQLRVPVSPSQSLESLGVFVRLQMLHNALAYPWSEVALQKLNSLGWDWCHILTKRLEGRREIVTVCWIPMKQFQFDFGEACSKAIPLLSGSIPLLMVLRSRRRQLLRLRER